MERTVNGLLDAGAAGARMIGGGFGGCALALFAPGTRPPTGSLEVRPGPGARVFDDELL
jgi:galactokinase